MEQQVMLMGKMESVTKSIIPSHQPKRQTVLMGKMDTHSLLEEVETNKPHLLMKEQRLFLVEGINYHSVLDVRGDK